MFSLTQMAPRWHHGTVYAYEKHTAIIHRAQKTSDESSRNWSIEESSIVIDQIKEIRKNRHPGQPYVS